MKTLMILGGIPAAVPVAETAIRMNIKTVLVDNNADAMCHKVNGIHSEFQSIIDFNAILELAIRYQIDGIMATVDVGVRTAAYVADCLNLPGLSMDTAICATDKTVMRTKLKQASVPVPDFYVVSDKEQLYDALKNFSKAIVKAADSTGSRGIYLVNDISDINDVNYAFEYAMKFSSTGKIIVEEHMEGSEICVDTIAYNDTYTSGQITDQLKKSPPYFTDCGYSQPACLSEDMERRVKEVAIAATKAIGNRHGVSFVEIMITDEGPKVVEIAARLNGDFITSLMSKLSCGIDMPEVAIKLALGQQANFHKKINKASCVRYFMKEKIGLIKKITGLDNVRSWGGGHLSSTPKSSRRRCDAFKKERRQISCCSNARRYCR